MLHGLARPRLRLVAPVGAPAPFPLRPSALRAPGRIGWAAERGTTLFAARCDVLGGFPGYADRAALRAVELGITDAFFLVDEGQAHGFALPIRSIVGSALVDEPERGETGLRVYYRDGDAGRVFTLRFRTNRLHPLGAHRARRAQAAMHAAGVRDRFAGTTPPKPAIALSWDRTAEVEREGVVWSGRASAPVCAEAELAPSRVWLSTESLIWGSARGAGINRVPLSLLADLISTRLRDRLGTPVVYVALDDPAAGRFELPFVFDRHALPAHNFRERDEFVTELRARGVTEGAATAAWRPWRTEPAARQRGPATVTTGVEIAPEAPTAPTLDGPQPAVDVLLAEWSVAASSQALIDVPLASSWSSPASLHAAETAPDCSPRRYEADALAAILDALRVVDDRVAGREAAAPPPAPASRDQTRALALLAASSAAGEITEEEARRRRERLLALAELGARLRTWIELHAAGHLSAGELARKRDAIPPGLLRPDA